MNLLDLFDYKERHILESGKDLIIVFNGCTLKKDLDCYPTLEEGDEIEQIIVNFDEGTASFSDIQTGFGEIEISTKTNLLEFS